MDTAGDEERPRHDGHRRAHRHSDDEADPRDDEVDPRVRRTQRDVGKAAGELLVEGGWNAVTHNAVAKRAGYSKVTLYKHWPGPADLGREAVLQAWDAPHFEPTGDLRDDLIGELAAFGDALVNQHLARVLAALAEQAAADPVMAELLAVVHADGIATMAGILQVHGYDNTASDTILDMLNGALIYRVMIRQLEPDREFIERIVDYALAWA